MEKYFRVTEKSDLYKEYFNYIENRKAVNEHVKRFMDEYGIKAQYYGCQGNYLYIEPTKEDMEKFADMLCKPEPNGLRRFKKNSKIGKAWAKSLKEANLKVLPGPFVAIYFEHCFHRWRSRLFHVGTVLYGSFESDTEFNLPEGFEEIKASEFYQILEGIESTR